MLDSLELTAAGTARPIVQYGERVLDEACAEVTEFGSDLEQLIGDMFASMYAARGVGLAANQIGVGLRVFVMDSPDDEVERVVGHVVNPVLEPHTGERILVDHDEGCLSVRGPRAEVSRLRDAAVTGFDYTGAPIRIEGHGIAGRCLQHEMDHLDGKLYLSRLTVKQRNAVLEEFEALRAAEAEGGTVAGAEGMDLAGDPSPGAAGVDESQAS
ncbi:MAG TPA: peptide deformylase [Jatrophihabitans sp.]